MALESRQPEAFAITFVFLGLATITVALRTASRAMLRQFRWGKLYPILALIDAFWEIFLLIPSK